jgi:hypothetical protein
LLEPLEERRLLAGDPLLVNTALEDANPLDAVVSLREALLTASGNEGADVIQFDTSLAGATIQLDSSLGSLVVDSDVEIDGLGAELLTVAGNGAAGGPVFSISPGVAATISGLTITQGNGGIYNDQGTLTLVDCAVSGNAAAAGGGISNSAGTVTITGCTISGNSATSEGGGINSAAGNLFVTNSTISGNTVLEDSGGGVASWGGTQTFTNSTISNNAAPGSGGGILNYGGTLTITGAIIARNATGWDGGGIDNYQGTLNITDSTISDNSSTYGGGVHTGYNGTATVSNCVVSGNVARGDGGGLKNYSGTLTVIASTISGNSDQWLGGGILNHTGTLTVTDSVISTNSSPYGGGIGNWYGALTVTGSAIEANWAAYDGGGINSCEGPATVSDSTVSNNVAAAGGGGGLVNSWSAASSLTVTDSVVSGNSAAHGGGIWNLAGSTTVSNSTIADNWVTSYGGGLRNTDGGSMIVTGSTVLGNHADNSGGGVDNWASTLTIEDSTFSSNVALWDAGGIQNAAAVLSVVDSSIVNNTALGVGGGVTNWSGTESFSSSTISDNSAVGWGGGGLFNSYGTVAVTDTDILRNSVSVDGGGIYSTGSLSIVGSTIAYNNSASYGGGVDSAYGSTTITASTVSNNFAGQNGGGVHNYYATVTIADSSISDNAAGWYGGGIHNCGTGLTVTDSTISDNSATYGGGLHAYSGGYIAVSDSTIEDNSANGSGGGMYLAVYAPTITRNVLAGNQNGGLVLESDSASVTGNVITQNFGDGIQIVSGYYDTIGGVDAGAGNTITGNSGAGVAVGPNSANVTIRGNVINSNGGLAIDLGNDGRTPNDAGDGDYGANQLQNYPVITRFVTGTTTQVTGSLSSTPNAIFTIDFYAQADGVPVNPGSSARYLGAISVTTDESGNATFDTALNAATLAGEFVSATATNDYGGTSEFSDLNLVQVTPVGGLITSEGGAQGMFTVVLATRPTADVTVALSSSDTSEGTVARSHLTFTSRNWNRPQTVTVTGVDDTFHDGPITYTIVTEPVTTADARLAGFDPDDVQVLNYDNDFADLTAIQPQGSLVYDAVLDGAIGTSGDTEDYRLRLDPGQTLSVLVEPSDGLRPTIKVLTANGALLDSATAPANGAAALLQTVRLSGGIADEVAGPRTYIVRIGGAHHTTGDFHLKVVLNAAIESEFVGNGRDDTRKTAQDLAESWVALSSAGMSCQQPARVAVLGDVSAGDATDTYKVMLSARQAATVALTVLHGNSAQVALVDNAGQQLALGVAGAADNVSQIIQDFVATKTGTYYLQVTGTAEYSLLVTRDTTFDVEANNSITAAQDVTTPEVASRRWVLGSISKSEEIDHTGGFSDPSDVVANGYASFADGSAVLSDGYNWGVPSSMFSRERVPVTQFDTTFTFQVQDFYAGWYNPIADGFTFTIQGVDSNALGWAGNGLGYAGIGSSVAVKFDLFDPWPWVGVSQTGLYTNGAEPQWDSIDLLPSGIDLSSPDPIQVTMHYDGTTLSVTITDTLTQASASQAYVIDIPAVVGSTTGYVGFTAATGGPPARQEVLSWNYYSAPNSDFYQITADANQKIEIATATPAGGSGQFINALDPMLRLYDAAGNLVASNENGDADGRNAKLSYKVPKNAGGNYYIEVASVAAAPANEGEYLLSVKSASVVLPAFEVTATSLADGTTTYDSLPSQVLVDFNDNILLSTLQAGDLTINGKTAFGVTATDGDSVVFSTPYAFQWSASAGGNDHFYLLTPNTATWNGAEAQAAALGGHLVSITSQSEQDFVDRTFLSDDQRHRILWCGLNDVAGEGDFVWSNGDSLAFTNFSAGEPNGGTYENYIALNWIFGNYATNDLKERGTWDDVSDDNSGNLLQGIIELDTLPAGYFVAHDGTYHVAIAAGAIKDVQGTPVTAYNGSFTIDQTPPRVVSSSIQQDAMFSPGNLTYTVTFSEPIQTSLIDSSDFSLAGLVRGNMFGPVSYEFDASSTTLTIRYADLPDDAYTLTLFSNPDSFQDQVALLLDGETIVSGVSQWPIGPGVSGNGVEGGNFAVSFSMDVGTQTLPVPLAPVAPLGSLVYQTSSPTNGTIAFAADTDEFTIALDAHQTVTVVVEATGELQPTITLFDPANDQVGGTAIAPAPGAGAVYQSTLLSDGGTYRISVGSAGGLGQYWVRLIVNAAVEEETYGGPRDDVIPGQSLDSCFIDLGDGASRAAVLGRSDGAGGYQAAAEAYDFIDISATGQAILQGADDYWHWLSQSDLAGFQFALYGAVSDNLFVSPNGFLNLAANNGYIYAASRDLVIWGAADAAVYWQVLGAGDQQTLVVQWNDVGFYGYGADPITFEVVLSETDGSIQFNYADLHTNVYYLDEGINATVGINHGWDQSLYLPTYNAPNELVGTGRSTRIANVPPSADYYAFQLGAGQRATVGLSSPVDISGSGVVLQLRDEADNLLALSGGDAAPFDLAISDFVAPATGTYYAVITSQSIVDYGLVVTRNADLESEINDASGTADELATVNPNGQLCALGYISSTTIDHTSGFSDSSDLVTNGYASYGDGAALITNGYDWGVPSSMFSRARLPVTQFDTTFTFQVQDLYAGWSNPIADGFTFTIQGAGPNALGWAGNGLGYAGIGSSVAVKFDLFDPWPWVGVSQTGLYTNGVEPQWDAIDLLPSGIDLSNPDPIQVTMHYDGTTLSVTITDTLTQATASQAYVIDIPAVVGSTTGYVGFTAATGGPPARQEILSWSYQGQGDSDFYEITVDADQTLTITTATPAGDPQEPFEFDNFLDPVVELYDGSRTLLGSNDNGAADGKNAVLSYTPQEPGTYYVRVRGASDNCGEYILHVTGAASVLPPFQVAATDPTEGTRLRGPLTEYTVDFNDLVLLPSLSASAVTFNDVAATGVTIVDGDTAVFAVPDGLAEGIVTVAIVGGSIRDIQGTPLEDFTATYYNDIAAPRVVASSIQEGQVGLAAGDLVYMVTFSEAMNAAVDPSGAPITTQYRGGYYLPTSIVFDDAGTTATLTYAGLPDDACTLTLNSWAWRDAVGNALDGETLVNDVPNWPVPPHESGDFVVHFATDADTQPLPTPLVAVPPAGSLIYQTPLALDGTIAFAGDTDEFTIDVDGGQTLTVTVQPDCGLQASIEVYDAFSLLVGGSVTGTFAGSAVILQTAPATTTGTYTIAIHGADLLGLYSVGLTLNAALEEETHGGAANNDSASAQLIEASFFPLSANADRGAVRGMSGDDDVYAFDLTAGQSLTAAVAFDLPLTSLFGLRTDYYAYYPRSIALGDVNNDTYVDMVTASFGGCNFSLRLGNGDGTFGPESVFGYADTPNAVVLSDLDCDGALDLISVNYYAGSNNDSVTVMRGNGDGTFQSSVNYYGGTQYNCGLAVGDVNGDTFPDIVTTSEWDYTVKVLINNGDGTFGAAAAYAPGACPTGVALADLDGVNGLDIVTANYYSSGLTVQFNNGDGTFGPATGYWAGGSNTAVAVADFNGDGACDVATVNEQYDATVSVLLNRGDGTLTPPASYRVMGINGESLAVGDVNGDGAPDLVAGAVYDFGYGAGRLAVFLNDNNGAGTFGIGELQSSANGTYGVAVNDLNGDGTLDIAAACYYGGVSVFLNLSTPTVLTLYGHDGIEIATSSTSASDYDALLSGFVATETGTYTLRLSSPAVARDYSLIVTRGVDLGEVSGGEGESSGADEAISLDTAYPWCNRLQPLDVSNDGGVSPIDALLVINSLNTAGSRSLSGESSGEAAHPFYDVNRDGFLSPLDALRVINYLNRPNPGEGEADLLRRDVVVTRTESTRDVTTRGASAQATQTNDGASNALDVWSDPEQDWIRETSAADIRALADNLATTQTTHDESRDLIFGVPHRRRATL